MDREMKGEVDGQSRSEKKVDQRVRENNRK